MKLDIVISIVTHNSDLEKIKKLLDQISLIKNINIKTYIIDNDSNSYYFNKLIKIYPHVISAGNNIGYGKAHNLLEKISPPSSYFLVLNPDINLPKNTIENLFNFLNQKKDCGLVSPILKLDDKFFFDFRRDNFNIIHLIKRRVLKTKDYLLKDEIEKIFQDKIFLNIKYVSGSFMFFRRDTFQQILGFNEKFFMYFEDVEICDRLRKVSKISILKNVSAYHYRQRDSYKKIKFLLIHFISYLKYKFT